MDAIDEITDTKDEDEGAEEADENGGFWERAGVENDEAHDGAGDTSDDPDETICGVNGGAETNNDLGDATDEGVARDGEERESDALRTGAKEKNEGGSCVKNCDENRDDPASATMGAMEGIHELYDAESEKKEADNGDGSAESAGAMEEHEPAKDDGESTFYGESEPMRVDITAIYVCHRRKYPCLMLMAIIIDVA